MGVLFSELKMESMLLILLGPGLRRDDDGLIRTS
jgi:hypothetical protein